jgi:tyrosyl-tRNA synthetase
VLSLLAEATNIFPSKGEAKRSLQENAVSINKNKVTLESKVNATDLLNEQYILAQKGKKNYYLIRAK